MDAKTRQILFLFAVMMTLSALTVFILEVSDTRTVDAPESSSSNFSFDFNISEYKGPGSGIINESVNGWRAIMDDAGFSLYSNGTEKENSSINETFS